MTFLVNANVLSEPTKPVPNERVVAWLSANERDLVVDAVILGELTVGVMALPPGRKRKQLEQWLDALSQTVECLPWDAKVSRRWARLVVDLKRKGKTMPLLDAMIAATGLEHDLTIATRNARDFKLAGLKVFDPFV